MFVQITDPDKALALYQAGLLWEKPQYVEEYQLALGWYKNKHGMMRANILSTDPQFTFYILLEE